MINSNFAKLIKTLQRETLDIKNTHRRSTLTVETITKSILVPVSATVNSSGGARPNKQPIIGVEFNSEEPQLFMTSFDNADPAAPFGINWNETVITTDGKTRVRLDLGYVNGQTPGRVITANFTLYFTSTGDFTLSIIQPGSD